MYIGGMQMTSRPTNAPSRIVDPPGTMRTPCCAVKRLSGSVSLSKNGHRPCHAQLAERYPRRLTIDVCAGTSQRFDFD
jgi:hypothetical protein